jgi:hypothetical protein
VGEAVPFVLGGNQADAASDYSEAAAAATGFVVDQLGIMDLLLG